jgi:hypothetical protein
MIMEKYMGSWPSFCFFDMTDARKEKRAKAFAEMEHTMA